ncbi:MAG: 4'-phosphopantetheinyl transferase superfamily protein [Bacteroidales bacterium]|nr:4'-phosphopantetheinyl transferase superfamily protein [Bacteroidales bacterium]
MKRILPDSALLLWDMSETPDEMALLLPPAFADVSEIRSQRRRRELLATRLLLCAAGCDLHRYSHGPHGEPHIDDPRYRHISVSHSNRIAGILLGRSAPVGLDIENMNRNFIRVEHKYLSENERINARKIPDGHGIYWCIKEALYKISNIFSKPETFGTFFVGDITVDLNKKCQPKVRLAAANQKLKFEILRFDEQAVVCIALN